MGHYFILSTSIGLGVAFVILYLWRCSKSKKDPDVSVIVASFFHSAGAACGLVLIAAPFYPGIMRIAGVELYIFAGGMSIAFISLRGFHRDAIRSSRSSGK